MSFANIFLFGQELTNHALKESWGSQRLRRRESADQGWWGNIVFASPLSHVGSQKEFAGSVTWL